MKEPIHRVAVVGAGAWGTALACVARRAGRSVTLWARERDVVDAIETRRENPLFLPGVPLDPGIRAVSDLSAVAGAEAVFLATPAQHLRSAAGLVAPFLAAAAPVVICAKGIEVGTSLLMSEVLSEALPGRPLAVLAGPTFAGEVARGLPAAATLAAADASVGRRLIATIGGPHFRPYLSDDLIGADVGGAVKNVLAIACGIVVGRRLGDNARAALLARGLAEMVRLGLAKGAKAATLMGLSGLGDLTLTCNGLQSRNLTLGLALGEGRPLAAILAERRTVAEGVTSAAAVTELARRMGVAMPISEAVDAIINRGADIDAAIAQLLARAWRSESEALERAQFVG